MGAGQVSCCVSRQAAGHNEDNPSLLRPPGSGRPGNSHCSVEQDDQDELLRFFECAETEDELTSEGDVPPARPRRLWSLSSTFGRRWRHAAVPMQMVPEEAGAESRQSVRRPASMDHREHNIIRRTREAWRERLEGGLGNLDEDLAVQLEAGFPELEEWTSLEVASRMFRAACGDEDQAVTMLTRAIESRVRRRELFQTMRCEVFCDIRVIGRDKEQRPTIYLCARNQHRHLREIVPQVFLAFEAASRLTKDDGQANLVADFHGFKARSNLDPCAMKELSESFGTVYADRLFSILIVDFSVIAQAVWTMLKPFLSERTRRKINFASEPQAKELAKQRLDGPTSERLISSFDLNRKRGSTDEERREHAKRTAICDVPLGAVRETDVAG